MGLHSAGTSLILGPSRRASLRSMRARELVLPLQFAALRILVQLSLVHFLSNTVELALVVWVWVRQP